MKISNLRKEIVAVLSHFSVRQTLEADNLCFYGNVRFSQSGSHIGTNGKLIQCFNVIYLPHIKLKYMTILFLKKN